MDAVKKRKPNWTTDECLYLTKLVEENKSVIRSKFGTGVTTQRKRETWRNITDAINSTSSVSRSVEDLEVEKKWHNLHMKGKAELAEHRKHATMTGGGAVGTEISTIAEAVVNVIGLDNVSICGIDGAVDTSMLMLMALLSSSGIGESDTSAMNPPVPSTAEINDGITALKRHKLELQIKNFKLQNQLLEIKIAKLTAEN